MNDTLHRSQLCLSPSPSGFVSTPLPVNPSPLGSGYPHLSKSSFFIQYLSTLSLVSLLAFSFSAFSVAIRDSFTVPIEGCGILVGGGRREIATAAWWIAVLYARKDVDEEDISASCAKEESCAREGEIWRIREYSLTNWVWSVPTSTKASALAFRGSRWLIRTSFLTICSRLGRYFDTVWEHRWSTVVDTTRV